MSYVPVTKDDELLLPIISGDESREILRVQDHRLVRAIVDYLRKDSAPLLYLGGQPMQFLERKARPYTSINLYAFAHDPSRKRLQATLDDLVKGKQNFVVEGRKFLVNSLRKDNFKPASDVVNHYLSKAYELTFVNSNARDIKPLRLLVARNEEFVRSLRLGNHHNL